MSLDTMKNSSWSKESSERLNHTMEQIEEEVKKDKALTHQQAKPVTPGKKLTEEYIGSVGMTEGKLSKVSGISLETLKRVLAGEQPVTPQIAVRLAKSLGTTPELWLNLQSKFDKWKGEG
ncbi:HigA family addiction module antitoxin [Dongshaea marina]|uniref:HigA family addiction module antitoxin n=1 Tax=Dongshaea marina TaxID=2047966 RepID=UPI000D3E124F|nr:HigA family addiction module antitoxin [Dongshaea marina]